jgi:hypothetical protein
LKKREGAEGWSRGVEMEEEEGWRWGWRELAIEMG